MRVGAFEGPNAPIGLEGRLWTSPGVWRTPYCHGAWAQGADTHSASLIFFFLFSISLPWSSYYGKNSGELAGGCLCVGAGVVNDL